MPAGDLNTMIPYGLKPNYRSGRSFSFPRGRKYANPLFPKKKKTSFKSVSRELPRRIKIFSAISILCLIVGGWFILYSNFFKVKNVEARGEGRVDPTNLQRLVFEQAGRTFFVLWPEDNILLFDIPLLMSELNRKYSFDYLSVFRKLPSTLIIDYKEKSYALIWLENSKYYYADVNGAVIEEVPAAEAEEKNYPIIDNQSVKAVTDRRIPAPKDFLTAVFSLYEIFNNYRTGDLVLRQFKYDQDGGHTVKAVLASGPELYFDASGDLEMQFNKLLALKDERIKEDFTKKTYIDLRYRDRVYYH